MKIKKIIFAIVVVFLAGTVGMLFYRKNSYPSPEVVTKTQLDAIFKENRTENENDGADLAALFMDKLQETQLACAMSEPAEHQEQFFENIMVGLQKINYEVTEISQSDEKTEVSVSINYFKLPELVKNAQKELSDEQENMNSSSTEEMVENLYKVIADEFQKGPSDDKKTEVTVTLYKNNHKWETDDKFEDEIFSVILQPY